MLLFENKLDSVRGMPLTLFGPPRVVTAMLGSKNIPVLATNWLIALPPMSVPPFGFKLLFVLLFSPLPSKFFK